MFLEGGGSLYRQQITMMYTNILSSTTQRNMNHIIIKMPCIG